jgi:YfiH family protein
VSHDWISADWPAPSNIVAGTILRDSDYELPTEPQWLNQVHGDRVVHAGSADFDEGPPDADAIFGDKAGDICVVATADCLPVLLCSMDGVEIAAVHAGWRGLSAGVIEATIAAMSSRPDNLIVWFGPAISQSAYEVGDEVRERFGPWGRPDSPNFTANERGRWQADLVGLATARLRQSGLSAVYGGGLCTYADEARFYSFRRDGSTGRLLSFIHRSL